MYALKSLHTQWKKYSTSSGIKDFCIYFVGALFLRGSSMIMAPFLLHKLLPQDYGLITLLHSFTGIVTILMGFGLRQAALSTFFHHTQEDMPHRIVTILYIYFFCASPVLLLGVYHACPISYHLFSQAAPSNLIIITLVYCFLFFFVEFMHQILAYQQQALFATYLQVSLSFFIIICNLFLLFYCNAGIYSMMISYVCGYSLVIIWAIYSYLRRDHLCQDVWIRSLKAVSEYLKLGLPFIPTLLFTWVLSSTTRWLLAYMATLQDVGIYALADSFGQLYMYLVLQPINNAYIPRLMHAFSKDRETRIETEQENRKITLMSMLVGIAMVTIACVCCKPLLSMLIPQSYQAALSYVWFIIIGNIFLTASCCFSAFIQAHQGAWFLAGSATIPTLLHILCCICCIPVWGIYGAIVTTTGIQILYCAIVYWYGNYLLKRLKSM